jgi:hypothetical protein
MNRCLQRPVCFGSLCSCGSARLGCWAQFNSAPSHHRRGRSRRKMVDGIRFPDRKIPEVQKSETNFLGSRTDPVCHESRQRFSEDHRAVDNRGPIQSAGTRADYLQPGRLLQVAASVLRVRWPCLKEFMERACCSARRSPASRIVAIPDAD